jgi:hypothetical protein
MIKLLYKIKRRKIMSLFLSISQFVCAFLAGIPALDLVGTTRAYLYIVFAIGWGFLSGANLAKFFYKDLK